MWSAVRGSARATIRSGPAPCPARMRANRSVRASSSANVQVVRPSVTATAPGSAAACATNNSGTVTSRSVVDAGSAVSFQVSRTVCRSVGASRSSRPTGRSGSAAMPVSRAVRASVIRRTTAGRNRSALNSAVRRSRSAGSTAHAKG